jgi:hypothetical protein
MDWGDRDWPDFEEPEQTVSEVTNTVDEPSRTSSRLRWTLLLLAVVALVVFGSVLAFRLPHLARGESSGKPAPSSPGHGRLVPLGGSPLATAPSTYTFRGRTASTDGSHVTGTVVLRGRWNHGAWVVLARTRTDAAGNFRVKSRLNRRGSLELRLSLPDGFIGTKTLHVR